MGIGIEGEGGGVFDGGVGEGGGDEGVSVSGGSGFGGEMCLLLSSEGGEVFGVMEGE